jgi:hypothetical protein
MERGKLMMENEQPADAPRRLTLTLNPSRPFRLRLRFRAFGPPPPSSCSLWLNNLRRFRLRVGLRPGGFHRALSGEFKFIPAMTL